MNVKWLLLVFLLPSLAIQGPGLQSGGLRVDTPQPGEALRGDVDITGSTDVGDFKSYEVAFAYESTALTWFVLNQGNQPVKSGTLATWKTSTIADGRYRLRLRVILKDDSIEEVTVPGLRVRNYTPIETSTPAPTRFVYEGIYTPTAAVTRTVRPTPTALPPNPAQVTLVSLLSSLAQGVLFVAIAFILLGVYWGLRILRRRRKSR